MHTVLGCVTCVLALRARFLYFVEEELLAICF